MKVLASMEEGGVSLDLERSEGESRKASRLKRHKS